MTSKHWWNRSWIFPVALLFFFTLAIWEPRLKGYEVFGLVLHWIFLAAGVWAAISGVRRILNTPPQYIACVSDFVYAAGWAVLFASGDGTGTENHRLFYAGMFLLWLGATLSWIARRRLPAVA